jgi:hypothetical protein
VTDDLRIWLSPVAGATNRKIKSITASAKP